MTKKADFLVTDDIQTIDINNDVVLDVLEIQILKTIHKWLIQLTLIK